MKDAQRPRRYYVSKAFICAAIVLQLVHLFLNFRAEMSPVLLLSGISLAIVVAFQITFMGFAGIENRVVAISYAISAVWTTILWFFTNAYRVPGAGINTLLFGISLTAYVAAFFEVLVFIAMVLSFAGVIRGKKYLAAAAVAVKLAMFLALAAEAAIGTNWAFMSGFIKNDSALIAYIRTGEYAGGPDIARFFDVICTCLALLGYLTFFASFAVDEDREDPYGIVNTRCMVFVSAVSMGAAQICWIDRIIAKINALTNARDQSVLRETLRVIFIPFYFIHWIMSRDKIVREEGLKLGYELTNRGMTSAILSIFTLGIAGSALLQSNLNRISADGHELTFEEVNEPADYTGSEPYNELSEHLSEDHDEMMFKPENRQYADETPNAQSPAILPPASMEYDDSAFSESPTLQYPFVGLPAEQEPIVPSDQPKEPVVRSPSDDKEWETASIPGENQPQRPSEGMSIMEASNRLEGLKSVMEAIRELSEMKSEGLITDEEFNKTKLALLSRL
jgi:hypothetical protein